MSTTSCDMTRSLLLSRSGEVSGSVTSLATTVRPWTRSSASWRLLAWTPGPPKMPSSHPGGMRILPPRTSLSVKKGVPSEVQAALS